jgi:hypothetical protein
MILVVLLMVAHGRPIAKPRDSARTVSLPANKGVPKVAWTKCT